MTYLIINWLWSSYLNNFVNKHTSFEGKEKKKLSVTSSCDSCDDNCYAKCAIYWLVKSATPKISTQYII